MNYELVKQLKDAGLVVRNHSLVPRKILHNENWSETIGEPTFSELIEACGKEFDYLKQVGDGQWAAIARKSDDGFLALSKEEAVARLWLALNKKA